MKKERSWHPVNAEDEEKICYKCNEDIEGANQWKAFIEDVQLEFNRNSECLLDAEDANQEALELEEVLKKNEEGKFSKKAEVLIGGPFCHCCGYSQC